MSGVCFCAETIVKSVKFADLTSSACARHDTGDGRVRPLPPKIPPLAAACDSVLELPIQRRPQFIGKTHRPEIIFLRRAVRPEMLRKDPPRAKRPDPPRRGVHLHVMHRRRYKKYVHVLQLHLLLGQQRIPRLHQPPPRHRHPIAAILRVRPAIHRLPPIPMKRVQRLHLQPLHIQHRPWPRHHQPPLRNPRRLRLRHAIRRHHKQTPRPLTHYPHRLLLKMIPMLMRDKHHIHHLRHFLRRHHRTGHPRSNPPDPNQTPPPPPARESPSRHCPPNKAQCHFPSPSARTRFPAPSITQRHCAASPIPTLILSRRQQSRCRLMVSARAMIVPAAAIRRRLSAEISPRPALHFLLKPGTAQSSINCCAASRLVETKQTLRFVSS